MKAIRWIAIGLAVIAVAIACVALVARFSDGPLGPCQGGPLVEGRLIETPVRDWSFVEPVEEVELQLLNPARSRTTWIVFHDGTAYIPCGQPNFRLWKQWPHQALADGRAVVRVGGDRYRVDLTRVEDSDLQRALRRKFTAKYPPASNYSGEVWHFALGPPAGLDG